MSNGFTFPAGFLWGAATAAHQVEGNNTNNDSWLLENVAGSVFAEPSGDAIDHYHRYRDDIALLAELGFNTYRFSLEWARIEPEEGKFSRASLDHYRRMLAACHEYGLKPILTYHHFTSPRWLLAAGGWTSPNTPDRFARFCEQSTRHLGDLIGAACTLNEPNLPVLLSAMGFVPPPDVAAQAPMNINAARTLGIPPQQIAPFQFSASPRAVETMIVAHHKGVQAIRSASPKKIPIGITLAIQDIQAAEGGEAMAAQMQQAINGIYLDELQGDDFVGVQTYSRTRFGPHGMVPPPAGAEIVTQMGYEFYPEALEATIRYAIAKTGLPVIVTENGIGTHDDTRRVEYIRRALHGVANCLRDGLDVRGYTYWSAFDNFEWSLGYTSTFGIIAVDRSTQRRTAKPSAAYLGNIAHANHLP